jgi:hypothetical protein
MSTLGSEATPGKIVASLSLKYRPMVSVVAFTTRVPGSSKSVGVWSTL